MAARIFINGRFLTQQTTGVQSFARSICAELEEVTDFTLLVPENGKIIDPGFENHILKTGKLKGHLWEQVHLPLFLRKHPGSVLLNLCNTGPAFVQNQVVTIHDLAFLKNPAWFHVAFARYYTWLIPRLAANSKAIITVSQTIKKELQESFGINDNKIYVTGNKIQRALLEVIPKAPQVPGISQKNYFLIVGSDDPRKNFSMAEQLFIDKFPNTLLVVAGGQHRSFQSHNNVVTSPKVIRLGYTDTATLRWLYENAIAFINPSLYEGFGIPNLEAFAFGCPVICSDLPVFREVCENAATYFNPQNPDSLNDAVQAIKDGSPLVQEKTNSGKVIFTTSQDKNRSSIILKALAL